jgi:hypothetical protein
VKLERCRRDEGDRNGLGSFANSTSFGRGSSLQPTPPTQAGFLGKPKQSCAGDKPRRGLKRHVTDTCTVGNDRVKTREQRSHAPARRCAVAGSRFLNNRERLVGSPRSQSDGTGKPCVSEKFRHGSARVLRTKIVGAQMVGWVPCGSCTPASAPVGEWSSIPPPFAPLPPYQNSQLVGLREVTSQRSVRCLPRQPWILSRPTSRLPQPD